MSEIVRVFVHEAYVLSYMINSRSIISWPLFRAAPSIQILLR